MPKRITTPPVSRPPQAPPAPPPADTSFINLLYDNFVEKWTKTITAANYLAKLKSLFDQPPPDINTEISPNDNMFVPEWRDHYFSVGTEALRCLKIAMMAAGKLQVRTILDLPCGHGRILRVLRAAFPEARITACDIDRDGVDFCAKTFNAIPIYSAEKPELIPLHDQYDLIWCGSLFSHLDQYAWPRFLRFFNARLKPGGLFVFTVHGREAVHWLRSGKYDYSLTNVPAILEEYDRDGFGYQDYPAHTLKKYGISLSTPAWVMNQIIEQTDLRLVVYTEKGWDNHQDVVVCVRR